MQEKNYLVHRDTISPNKMYERIKQSDERLLENYIRSQVTPDENLIPAADDNDVKNPVKVRRAMEPLLRPQGEADENLEKKVEDEEVNGDENLSLEGPTTGNR